MSSTPPAVENDQVSEGTDRNGFQALSEVSMKRRLSERFTIPGALVVCYRRTLIGTWKPCGAPFHVHNVGMGGLNFWNLGIKSAPGSKIKMTILLPKLQPIEVIGMVVWSKDVPPSDSTDGAQRYTQITGVRFVDYDADAWSILRQVHRAALAGS